MRNVGDKKKREIRRNWSVNAERNGNVTRKRFNERLRRTRDALKKNSNVGKKRPRS